MRREGFSDCAHPETCWLRPVHGRRPRGNPGEKLSGSGVVVTQYFPRDIDPPQKVKTAIEERLSGQQDVATEEHQTQIVQEMPLIVNPGR